MGHHRLYIVHFKLRDVGSWTPLLETDMRNKSIAAAALLMVNLSGPAFAESGDGKHKKLLVQALEASAKGNCPAAIMSPLLLGACESQMPNMGNMLGQKGKIVSTKYLGNQATPNGPAEVFLVSFDKGKMTWMINTGSDGKIVVLWSQG